jgi:hypothetical protein
MKAFTFLKIVTFLNLAVATGFSIVGMINPFLILPANTAPDKAVTVFALYAGARTIPFAIGIVAIFNKRWNAFVTLAFLAGVIQLLDGFIGIYQHDVSKSAGPFVIAAIEFIAIYFTVKSNNYATKA